MMISEEPYKKTNSVMDSITGKEVQKQFEEVQIVKPHLVREFLFDKWGGKCAYCGKSDRILVLEHIIPRSRGGTDALSNLTLSCYDCNITKAGKTAAEFGFPEVQQKAVRFSQSTKTKSCHLKNLNLTIVELMSSGKTPIKISRELNISKSRLQYHLNQLKREGIIHKLSYGIWGVSKDRLPVPKTKYKVPHVVTNKTPQQAKIFELLRPDSVRAHAFVFTVSVPPHLRNWNNKARSKYLTKHKISFTELNIGGGGQRIIFHGKKTWLTNRSVVIYDRSSYFSETSTEARSYAISKLLSLIKGLERLLHADFTERAGRQYRFKVSRQHYALVKNALAKQYDAEGKKLQVYAAEKGLWFLIDNSFNLHEAETVHPETADVDSKKVQDFFNSLKEQPLTTGFILEVMNGIQQNQLIFSQNMGSHIKVIKDLGKGVNELTERIEELKNFRRLDEAQKTLEGVEKE